MLDRFFRTIEIIIPKRWRWILNHEGFKRYFANTGWMFFGQMFSLIISFFVGAWLARYLGPENYGILSYSIAFVGLFSFLSSLGIDGILSRELVAYPEQRDKLLGTAFRLKLFGGAAAFLLTSLCVLFFQADFLIRMLVILFASFFILQPFNIIGIFFQSEVKSKNNFKPLLLATVISSILKVLVILLQEGVIWIMLIYALDSVWQGIGFIRAYKRYGLRTKDWQFDKNLARKILKNSWPLMLASAAGFIYLKIDQVIIGILLGNRDVGIYAAAVKLVEVGYFIPGIICASLFPAIVNARKNSLDTYHNRLKNFYILMSAIPLLLAIPVVLLAGPIISVLFGQGYLESAGILRVYVWSNFGLFLGMAITQSLMSENLVKSIFWLNFFAMIINVILNFLLIPFFGLSGAAWATLISYLVIPLGSLMVRGRARD